MDPEFDLFGAAPPEAAVRREPGANPATPLAERLRPRDLGAIVGQDHLLAPDGALGPALAARALPSLILWGPPGCGKTTLARLLAERVGLAFLPLSAVFAGVADLRRAFEAARTRRRAGQGTLLFVDEIHRFNRGQQDGLLPVVEDGTVTLVGATTENPSFALNAALLSRCRVLVLRRLDAAALETLLARAEAALGHPLPLAPEGRTALIAMADGDGRYLLNLAEAVAQAGPEPLGPEALAALLQRRAPVYDKAQEGHYNLISALHKSVRGSDPDAALYYLARMLAAGEEPAFLARRLVRMAVEDIGLAAPGLLAQTLAAWDAWTRLGSPEGELALAQVTVALALAPKSNAVYRAFGAAHELATETGSLAPPAHILNAPTGLMRALGYGAGYQYDHDAPDGVSGQSYWPDGVAPATLYDPTDRGEEAALRARLAALRARRAAGAG